MSFDPRSLERLRQLGRTLPQPLPQPQLHPPSGGPEPSGGSPGPAARERRHRVETEQNPEQLFRELMRVSPDGTVPPHLLERLKQVEASQRAPEPEPASRSGASSPGPAPGAKSRRAPIRRRPGSTAAGTAADRELYSAFEQLLLEDDD